MYTLSIREYVRCAHSLRGEHFGLAQILHVVTYEVEASFVTPSLDVHGVVVDFGAAQQALWEIVGPLNFQNLDELPQFRGQNTTTEFLSRHVHEQLAQRLRGSFRGLLRVTLRESPVAWTTYEAEVPS